MNARILISFGRPHMGVLLLRLAHMLRPKAEIQAIHFSPDPTVPREEAAYTTAESFDRIKTVADELKTGVRFLYREASNITDAIVRHADNFEPDWLFLGAAGLFASEQPLGGRVGEILQRTGCNVGVVLDRGLEGFSQFVVIRDARHGAKISGLFTDAAEHTVVELCDSTADHTAIASTDGAVTVLSTECWSTMERPSGSAIILRFVG